MTVVIRAFDGRLVEDCDVDAMDGIGLVHFTHFESRAKKFASAAEAMRFWRRQSTVRPIRPDGKPNRPLTAFSCTLEQLE